MEVSNESYKQTLEYLPGALIDFYIERMAVTYMNRMAIHLFQFDRDEVENGIPVREIFANEQEFLRAQELVESFGLESFRERKPYQPGSKQELHDFWLKRKDGSTFCGGCQASFILDQEHIPIGIRVYIRDLTDERRTKEALQASEETYRTLVEYSSDLIFLIAPGGKVLSVNQAAAHSIGSEAEKIIGRNLSEIFPEEVAEQYRAKLEEVFATGKGSNSETCRTDQGQTVWINTTLNPVKNEAGKIISILGVSRDVTERKLAESRIEESDRLRELLLDVITHDLKTPAGVIYGLSDMARESSPDDEVIESIYLSSQRLLEVLENTTILSRAVFGERIPKQVLQLRPLVKEISRDFASQVDSAGMSLEINVPAELKVTANPLIGEVIKNYISNAAKYARSGDRIIVEAMEGKDSVIIGVKDEGQTIPSEKRALIFERGAQLHRSGRKGRGLGLAIVKRIAEAHDGDVGVEPNHPKGNIFYFNIPK